MYSIHYFEPDSLKKFRQFLSLLAVREERWSSLCRKFKSSERAIPTSGCHILNVEVTQICIDLFENLAINLLLNRLLVYFKLASLMALT
jgi:hypothetical protein